MRTGRNPDPAKLSGVAAATQTRYYGEKTFPKLRTRRLCGRADCGSRGPRGLRAKRNQTATSAAASTSEPTTATTFAAGPAGPTSPRSCDRSSARRRRAGAATRSVDLPGSRRGGGVARAARTDVADAAWRDDRKRSDEDERGRRNDGQVTAYVRTDRAGRGLRAGRSPAGRPSSQRADAEGHEADRTTYTQPVRQARAAPRRLPAGGRSARRRGLQTGTPCRTVANTGAAQLQQARPRPAPARNRATTRRTTAAAPRTDVRTRGNRSEHDRRDQRAPARAGGPGNTAGHCTVKSRYGTCPSNVRWASSK